MLSDARRQPACRSYSSSERHVNQRQYGPLGQQPARSQRLTDYAEAGGRTGEPPALSPAGYPRVSQYDEKTHPTLFGLKMGMRIPLSSAQLSSLYGKADPLNVVGQRI